MLLTNGSILDKNVTRMAHIIQDDLFASFVGDEGVGFTKSQLSTVAICRHHESPVHGFTETSKGRRSFVGSNTSVANKPPRIKRIHLTIGINATQPGNMVRVTYSVDASVESLPVILKTLLAISIWGMR